MKIVSYSGSLASQETIGLLYPNPWKGPRQRTQKFFAAFFQKSSPAALFATLLICCTTAEAQEADWPCAQRLVSTLSPGSYWSGPVPEHTGWRDEDTLFPLVTAAADRDTPEPEATAKLRAYIATLSPTRRATALPALFSALTDQTNDQRSLLIVRLEQLGRRQHNMGQTIAAISNKLDALPPGSPDRDALTGERDFDVRAFQETQHTMRYACEVPGNMERRLGGFAQLLQKK